jgi:hypothetical protein
MNENELERLAARLGDSAAKTLDAEKIAERVLARLDEPEILAFRRAPVIRWIGGLAAAAMVIVALGLALTPGTRSPDRSAVQSSVLQELDGLGEDQLEQLLQTMPATSSTLPEEPVPLRELDTLSLKRLLRTLEG